MPLTAAVAGATGLVGGHCLRLLLDNPAYERVIALARRPLDLPHAKLEELLIDFDALGTATFSADHVFCALGTTIRKVGSQAAFRRIDHDYVVTYARRALECGARKFLVVSSIGADPHSSNFYLRTKGEVEGAVSALPFEAVHIFRPSFLMGQRNESRPGERIGIAIARALQWAFVGSLRKYRPVEAERVARAMIAAALTPVRGIHIYEYDAIRQLSGP